MAESTWVGQSAAGEVTGQPATNQSAAGEVTGQPATDPTETIGHAGEQATDAWAGQACCARLAEQLDWTCEIHDDPFECPDALIIRDHETGIVGLPIHDGDFSYLPIFYCPWCGTALDSSDPLDSTDPVGDGEPLGSAPEPTPEPAS